MTGIWRRASASAPQKPEREKLSVSPATAKQSSSGRGKIRCVTISPGAYEEASA